VFNKPSTNQPIASRSLAEQGDGDGKAPTSNASTEPVVLADGSEPFQDPRTSDHDDITDLKNERSSNLAQEHDRVAFSENIVVDKKRDERGQVLEFNGYSSYIDVGHIPFDSFEAFTIEAWVKDWGNMIVYQGKEGDPENSVWLGWGTNGWIIGWESVNGRNHVYRIEREPSEKWEHVALVFDGENQYVFADGELVQEMPAPKPGPMHDQRHLLVGAQQTWKPTQTGETQRHGYGRLAALKISSTARYTKPFKPSKKFQSDKQTELLYDMSRPDEKTLDDISLKKRHGKLHEVLWISDAENDS
jgi:hypothetical protein